MRIKRSSRQVQEGLQTMSGNAQDKIAGSVELRAEEMRHRMGGGLLGRCVGNLMGVPFQGWPVEAIAAHLKAVGAYPLEGYVPQYPEEASRAGYMHRVGFTTEHVAEEWLRSLPYRSNLTAERQAYANLVRGLVPPAAATFYNPFREWIGALIRADVHGYICPGNPRRAAELAYRDARLSHTKNGIYGFSRWWGMS